MRNSSYSHKLCDPKSQQTLFCGGPDTGIEITFRPWSITIDIQGEITIQIENHLYICVFW